jgi:hypothetical protein
MFAAVGYREFWGWLAVVVMCAAYSVQLWETYHKRSEPHPVAWIGFGFLTAVGFLVQRQSGAGAGSLVMGFTALFCFGVGLMSLLRKAGYWHLSDFDGWDWGALIAGGAFFAVYLISRRLSWGPLVSVVLATLADLLLYIPIFKRAKTFPDKESAWAYGLNAAKFVPSLVAMDVWVAETLVYPLALIGINASVVWYLRRRKRQMRMLAKCR